MAFTAYKLALSGTMKHNNFLIKNMVCQQPIIGAGGGVGGMAFTANKLAL